MPSIVYVRTQTAKRPHVDNGCSVLQVEAARDLCCSILTAREGISQFTKSILGLRKQPGAAVIISHLPAVHHSYFIF